MPRPRNRVCLQDGLKLDLNQLARQGFIKFGADIGARGISWTNPRQGQVARGVISANMTKSTNAWFRIAIGGFVQQITLVSRPRHFGGCQFFFVCPVTGGLATVLWKPPGAARFCSRQAWGRQVGNFAASLANITSGMTLARYRHRDRVRPRARSRLEC
jgi:hypothetical protein